MHLPPGVWKREQSCQHDYTRPSSATWLRDSARRITKLENSAVVRPNTFTFCIQTGTPIKIFVQFDLRICPTSGPVRLWFLRKRFSCRWLNLFGISFYTYHSSICEASYSIWVSSSNEVISTGKLKLFCVIIVPILSLRDLHLSSVSQRDKRGWNHFSKSRVFKELYGLKHETLDQSRWISKIWLIFSILDYSSWYEGTFPETLR